MNFTMSIEIDLVTHECMHLLLRSPKFMNSVLVYIDVSANTKKNWLGIGLATLKAVGLTIIDKYSQIEIKRRKIMGISAFIYILCLLNYQYWSAAFASIFSYPVYSNKYMKSS